MPSPRLLWALTAFSVLFGLAATLGSAWRQDPTYDEPVHLQWAKRLVEERVSERASDPMWNSKTPATVPNALAKSLGRRWGWRGSRALTFWSRLPGVCWYLALVAGVHLVARALAGRLAGHIATWGVALDPNIVAHSSVATVDAPYAWATLAATAGVVAYARRPHWRRACLAGVALGLAFATKFTAFLLLPALALTLAVLRPWRRFGETGVRRAERPASGYRAAGLGHLLVAAGAAVACLCAAYFFVDVGPRLGNVPWKSAPLLWLAGWLPRLRLPLPTDFLTGLDICVAHERGRAWSVLVLDRSFPDGVWWYFLVSGALKTPLVLLAALGAGGGLWLRHGLWRRPEQQALALTLGVHLAYFSFLFRAQIGYRYMLLGVPLVWVLSAAGLAAVRWTRSAAWLAGAGVLLAALAQGPYLGNALAYTNVFVRPKQQAFRFLTNSSLDWGQNDEQVRPWLERRGWGSALFEPTHVRPGRNVLSVNSVAGAGLFRQHRWLREHAQPAGHFRHTYVWFDLDEAQYERFLDEDRTLTPGVEDERACAGPTLRGPFEVGALAALPATDEPFPAWVVCVETGTGTDLGLHVASGTPLLGRPAWLVREWDRLRPGEQAWYRLRPGKHALALTRLARYAGRFELRGGPARFYLRPGRVRKARPLELL